MLKYDLGTGSKENWLVAETDFDIDHQGKCEAIMCLGNGYMGQRAAFEERYVGQTRDMLINGTFNRFDEFEVTELPNVADVTNLEFILDDERFSMDRGTLTDYLRVLDLQTGGLTRTLDWTSPRGKRYRFVFERFVSMVNDHLLGLRASVTPLDEGCVLRLDSGINGQVTNTGSQHFHEGTKRIFNNTILRMSETTIQSKVTICLHTAHKYLADGAVVNGKILPIIDRRALSIRGTFSVDKGSTFTVEKLTAVTSSRDLKYENLSSEDAAIQAEDDGLKLLQVSTQTGYDALFQESKDDWMEFWFRNDIRVVSDKAFDQLTVRFALYHLSIMASRNDARMGIGAKGLSGEGYKGHSFWDTEIFTLPYFVLTRPAIARNLLTYRYKGLYGARKKAEENGCRGAMYPWEAAWVDDGEVTPLWGAADIVTGEPIPILTGLIEQHITADVVFGVWQYFTATGDQTFMDNCGYEMILDTARYWGSRVEWDEQRGQYGITNVIGPDEYKERVSNNAYTNYMAEFNMELALKVMDDLEQLGGEVAARLEQQFDFSGLRQEISVVLDKMYLPQPDQDGIIPQFDGYFNLKHIDLAPYKSASRIGTIYNDYNQEQIGTFQVHKQADTVLLLLLKEDLFSAELKKKNYYFYESRTLHDSSLSKSTHCVLAADLGEEDTSYHFYEGCGDIDLGPNMSSSDAGVHTASLGGIWQCAVYGFGGCRVVNDDLRIVPRLPKGWHSLSFPLVWRDQPLKVSIDHYSLAVENRGHQDVFILLNNNRTKVAAGCSVSA